MDKWIWFSWLNVENKDEGLNTRLYQPATRTIIIEISFISISSTAAYSLVNRFTGSHQPIVIRLQTRYRQPSTNLMSAAILLTAAGLSMYC